MNQLFNVDYFIDFFSAIPEEKWCVGRVTNEKNQHCAFGHGLAADQQSNFRAFQRSRYETLINIGIERRNNSSFVALVNNGSIKKYTQPTPKQRTLAFLHDLKAEEQAQQAVEVAQCIINSPVNEPEYEPAV